MQLIFTKLAGKWDRLRIVRADGSTEDVPQPKQKIIPHDMVHFVVEEVLGGGFLALVADGGGAGFAAGTASPAAEPVERLVETLQAEAWGPPAPPADVIALYETACMARGHASVPVTPAVVEAMRDRLVELQIRWDAVPVGGSLTVEHMDRRAAAA